MRCLFHALCDRNPWRVWLVVVALAVLGAADGKGETQISYQIGNGTTSENVEIGITNNNAGVIFESAAFQFEAMINGCLEFYRARSTRSGASTWTIADFHANGALGTSISPAPTSEVYLGWVNTVQPSGEVSLTHGPFGYHIWYGTQQPTKNKLSMSFTLDTDLNQNTLRDPDEYLVDLHQLFGPSHPGTRVVDGFEAMDGVFSYTANLHRFTFSGALAVPALRPAPGVEILDAGDGTHAVVLRLTFANANSDAVFDALTLDLASGLLQRVWTRLLTDNAALSGLTVADLLAKGYVTAALAPGSEVQTGWSASFDGTEVRLRHSGGEPDSDFTVWTHFPATDTLTLDLRLGAAPGGAVTDARLINLLDLDGSGSLGPGEEIGLRAEAEAADAWSVNYGHPVPVTAPAPVLHLPDHSLEQALEIAALKATASPTPGPLRLEWQAVPDRAYWVQTTTDLSDPMSWETVAGPFFTDTPGPMNHDLPMSGSGLFGRILIW